MLESLQLIHYYFQVEDDNGMIKLGFNILTHEDLTQRPPNDEVAEIETVEKEDMKKFGFEIMDDKDKEMKTFGFEIMDDEKDNEKMKKFGFKTMDENEFLRKLQEKEDKAELKKAIPDEDGVIRLGMEN